MSTKDDGGPAFPITPDNLFDLQRGAGMSLRDYFAAKSLEAILRQLDRGIRPGDCIRAAEDAYFMADAMLTARVQP